MNACCRSDSTEHTCLNELLPQFKHYQMNHSYFTHSCDLRQEIVQNHTHTKSHSHTDVNTRAILQNGCSTGDLLYKDRGRA